MKKIEARLFCLIFTVFFQCQKKVNTFSQYEFNFWRKVRVLSSMKRMCFHYLRIHGNLNLMAKTGKLRRQIFAKSLKVRLYERNWFPFGSSRCSRKNVSLKIFLALYEQKVDLIQKRAKDIPERAFYYFLKFPKLVL